MIFINAKRLLKLCFLTKKRDCLKSLETRHSELDSESYHTDYQSL